MNIIEIKPKHLRRFFHDRPAIKKTEFALEVGISRVMLNYIIFDDANITEKTRMKLLPVMKKYGYNSKRPGEDVPPEELREGRPCSNADEQRQRQRGEKLS
jgi:Zn-dependent peptidase ImmA (M78 family)